MKIISIITNAKFRYKLMLTYLCLGIIPIICMGIIWYSNAKAILIEKEEINIKNYLSQSVLNMDNQLKIYDNLSDYIGFNQTIHSIIRRKYDSYYEMYTQFSNVLDPMLSSIKYFHSDINRITIYTKNNIIKHDTTIAPISEVKDKKWYSKLDRKDSNIHWSISENDKYAISARNIPSIDSSENLGVLYIDIDYSMLFESFKNIKDSNYGIFILDENDINIFNFNKFDKENEYARLDFRQFLYNNDKTIKYESDSKYMFVKCDSSNNKWKIFLYKPKDLIYKSIKPIFIKTILVIFFIVVVAFVISSILSRVMVSRIEKLRKNMQKVEDGDMNITVYSENEDEIGDLVRSFRKMIDQIKMLIKDVYESRLLQKEYEMRALQAQINPHFLYNTLSLINWMALEVNQKEISKITLSLSCFYRTALNKGKNILLVKDEIKNMKSYLDIQLMMHDYDFDVSVEIEDNILEYKILNLLLQPLIENSINHGIDLKEEGKGLISIIGKREENDILLVVKDNGVGMSQDRINEILTSNSKGYGVRNVNERIKLYYGLEYNLRIYSEIGVGTTIIVRIPAQK